MSAVVVMSEGSLVLRAVFDDDDKVTEVSGPLKSWAEDLIDQFGEVTREQVHAYFNYRYKVYDDPDDDEDEEGDDEGDDGKNLPPKPDMKNRGKVTKKAGDVEAIVKMDDDKRLLFGWAYVTHDKDGTQIVDKSGEFVDDPEELEHAAYDYVIKARMQSDLHRPADHPQRQVGVLVESIVFTPEKIAKMGIPEGILPTGWWVGFRVEDPEVWQAVKRGERPAFSVHGSAIKEAVE